AGALGLRVFEDKAFADQARVVVQRRPVEEPEALLVDEHLRVVGPFDHLIVWPRLGFPGKDIAQPRAPARLDPNPQSATRHPLLIEQLLDLFAGILRDANHAPIVTARPLECRGAAWHRGDLYRILSR